MAEKDEIESKQKEFEGIVNPIMKKVYMVDVGFIVLCFDLRLL